MNLYQEIILEHNKKQEIGNLRAEPLWKVLIHYADHIF